MRNRYILIILIAMLWSCSDRPKDIIPEEKMVEIMADLQIAEAYERSGKNMDQNMQGSNRELIGRGVLMQHGVSVEQMDSTLAWYGRNMDEYAKLYTKVDERLAKLQQKYAKAAGESHNNGPSSDIWPYGQHFVIDRNQLTNGLVVNIPVPDLSSGDRLLWKMRILGASMRHLTLGVEYDNGRMEIVDNNNREMEPWVETTLQTDTLNSVTNVFAILQLEHSTPRAFIDSIQLIHYPFSIEEYHKAGYQRKIGVARHKIEKLRPDSVKVDEDSTELVADTTKVNIKPSYKARFVKRK